MNEPLPDSCSGHSGKNLDSKSILSAINANSVPGKYITYTPPRIVKTKTRWYLEYYYLIPLELRKKYGNKKWGRQRVFADINRRKSDEYNDLLLKNVSRLLAEGFSPYQVELEQIYEPEQRKEWSLNYGLDQYLENCKEKGLRKKSLQTYGIIVNKLREYFLKGNKVYQPLSTFSKDDIKGFLKHIKKTKQLVNSTYNSYLTSTRTIFNWFVQEEKLEKNPADGIQVLPVNVTKHKYYDDKTAAELKKMLLREDPYMFKFCEFIYYTGTRPKSETRFLQVKHILFDRNLLFVPGGVSKNKKDDYIPMSNELVELCHSLVDGFPGDYYIFGKKGPEKMNVSQNYFAQRFKPFKDRLGLSSDYTLYGFKHLRAIHLAQDGANPYDIMRIFRHSSLEMTMIYLRELGITDQTEAMKKTRKF